VDSDDHGGSFVDTAIQLYVGINETKWNHHPVQPGGFACISPVYGRTERTKKVNPVKVPWDTVIIQDSGAFCDGPGHRLDFEQALARQVGHAMSYRYESQIRWRASYDLLIDEKWENGTRHKRRWTVEEADAAVEETIGAARYLRSTFDNPVASHILKEVSAGFRRPGFILSAQGVDAEQYLDCVKDVVPLVWSSDCLGLGGWCITGRNKTKMLPEFLRTVKLVIPYIGKVGYIHNVHIWGVLLAEALGPLLWLCDQYDLRLSTDSSGPSWRPAFGEWGYAEWRDNSYVRPPVETRGLERTRHVQATRDWLARFRETKWYREP